MVLDQERFVHNRIPPHGLFNPGLFPLNVRAFYKLRSPSGSKKRWSKNFDPLVTSDETEKRLDNVRDGPYN